MHAVKSLCVIISRCHCDVLLHVSRRTVQSRDRHNKRHRSVPDTPMSARQSVAVICRSGVISRTCTPAPRVNQRVAPNASAPTQAPRRAELVSDADVQ